MKNDEPIKVYSDEQLYEMYEYQNKTIEDIIVEHLCKDDIKYFDFVVTGTIRRWDGVYYSPALVFVDIEEFIDNLNIDCLKLSVFGDRIELANIHHDGVNYYTINLLDWGKLTIKQMKQLIEYAKMEPITWFIEEPMYMARKIDFIKYLHSYYTGYADNIPMDVYNKVFL